MSNSEIIHCEVPGPSRRDLAHPVGVGRRTARALFTTSAVWPRTSQQGTVNKWSLLARDKAAQRAGRIKEKRKITEVT